MIEEASRRLPAMVAVGAIFLLGFITIALATVVSVLADDTPEPATVAVLALSSEFEVIDAHQTCDPLVCDGEVAVVRTDGHSAAAVQELVETRLRERGWWEHRCGESERCLRRNDLGVEVVPWAAVVDLPESAAMRATVENLPVDQTTLVYVKVFRCNVRKTCEARPASPGSSGREGFAPLPST